MASRERTNLLPQQNRKHNVQKEEKGNQRPMEITNYTEKPNHKIQGQYQVLGHDPRQQIEFGKVY